MAKKKKNHGKSKPVFTLAWTFHPLRSNLRQALLVICIMVAFSGLVYWNFKEDLFLTLLSAVIYVVSLKNFFFPTSYVLKEDEIIVKNIFSAKYNWSRFRRFSPFKRGIFLSPYDKPSRMDHYRGIALFCEGDNFEKVLGLVEEKLT